MPRVSLAVGEPRHATPQCILDAYSETLTQLNRYPTTRGSQALRSTFSRWLAKRFALSGDVIHEDRNVLPVNGTREALFACAQCMVDPARDPVVLIPNPFYQIYEGAALLAGAQPVYYDGEVVAGDIPALWDLEDAIWDRVQLVIVTAATPFHTSAQGQPCNKLIELSRRRIRIDSDGATSEIYPRAAHPPVIAAGVLPDRGTSPPSNALHSTACRNAPTRPGCAQVLSRAMRD